MMRRIVPLLVLPLLVFAAGCASMDKLKDMIAQDIKNKTNAAAAQSAAGRVMIDGKLVDPPYRGPLTIEEAVQYKAVLNGTVIGTAPSRGLNTAGPYQELQKFVASISQAMKDGKFVCIDTQKQSFATRESSDFDKTKQLLASDKTADQKASELDQMFGGSPVGKDIAEKNK